MKRKIFVTIFVTILMANCLKWNSSKSPVFAIIGTDNSLPGDVPAKFRISGIASGLTGSGLILQNDGGDDLAVASNGKFEFGKTIPDKSHYSVTVSVQPQNPVQFCSVANGTGIISEKDVTDISVNCSPGYSIGGTITGLTGTLVLQNNNSNSTSMSSSGSFTMNGSIFTGNSYSISILSQPAGETCYISFPSGTVLSADVTSVGINCVSGTISGILSGGNVIVPSLISSPVLEKPSAAPAFSDFFAGASDFGPGFFDGYGNSAKFDKPYAITTDGLNIYVADSNNYAIRKVQISDGLVSTLATGIIPGLTAITTDGRYVYASTLEYTIVRLDLLTSALTTIAGTAGVPGNTNGVGAMASFDWCGGITTDGSNLYVADTSNNLIRKLNLLTMEVTTLSGNGIADTIDGIGTAASFNRPNAISFYDNTLYIGEVSGHRIRQLDLGTSEVTTIAGSGTQGTSPNPVGLLAELDNPSALVADSSNLYVLDTNNYLAWKISRTFPHSVSVYMGCFSGPVIGSGIGSADLACDPGEGTFAYPRGITTDGISIFVTEYNHNLIRKID